MFTTTIPTPTPNTQPTMARKRRHQTNIPTSATPSTPPTLSLNAAMQTPSAKPAT